MPKTKEEKVISESNGWKHVSVMVGQPDKTQKPTEYTFFSSADKLAEGFARLKEMVDAASAEPGSANELLTRFYGAAEGDEDEDEPSDDTESAQSLLVRYFNTSVDRTARQRAYVAAVQESTIISVPGEPKEDIMDFPLKNLVRGINGYLLNIDTRMGPIEIAANKEPDAAKRAAIIATGRKATEKAVKFGPWKTAMKKLIESGKARMNDASGMLEQVGN